MVEMNQCDDAISSNLTKSRLIEFWETESELEVYINSNSLSVSQNTTQLQAHMSWL